MSSRTRRSTGEGGFQYHADGKRVRGHRRFNGVRVFTQWQPNKAAAASALKNLQTKGEDEKTVLLAIEAWMAGAKLAGTTRSGYETSKTTYLRELLDVPVASLTRGAIVAHWDALANRGLALSVLHQAANVLSKALDYAVDREWEGVTVNVSYKITLPHASKKKITGLEPVDRLTVLKATEGDRFESRWKLGLLWGIRPGEAVGLTWRDIDFESGIISVVGQLQELRFRVDGAPLGAVYRRAAKSHSGVRAFKLDYETLRLLADYKAVREAEARPLTEKQVAHRASRAKRIARAKELGLFDDPELYGPVPDDLVFRLESGDPLLPSYDSTLWKRLLERSTLGHTRRYAARHTAVNHLLVSGAPLPGVSVMIGHGTAAFTQRVYGGSLNPLTNGLAAFFNAASDVPQQSQLPFQLPLAVTPSNIRGTIREPEKVKTPETSDS
jgi:integrase